MAILKIKIISFETLKDQYANDQDLKVYIYNVSKEVIEVGTWKDNFFLQVISYVF